MYRFVRPDDDVDLITRLLHEAYSPLAAQGLRFVAAHQSSETTARRMSCGETILALDGDAIVGTITLRDADKTQGSPLYDRPDVASFGQYAVVPSHQGEGIGSSLLNLVEQRAREKGVNVLALDTSEGASHLVSLYRSKGYEFVEHVRWPDVNYRSVILSKTLV